VKGTEMKKLVYEYKYITADEMSQGYKEARKSDMRRKLGEEILLEMERADKYFAMIEAIWTDEKDVVESEYSNLRLSVLVETDII
jgi:hypothetical protein